MKQQHHQDVSLMASGSSRCGSGRARWFTALFPVLFLACGWSGVLQAGPLESRPMVGREMVRQQGWQRLDFWQVLREEAESLRSMGLHREVASVLARADELLRKGKGVRQSTILRNELERIHALIRVGDPEAEKKVHDFLDTLQKKLGQDNPEVLYARHLLTLCMIAKSDITGAETLLKDVVERRARVLGAGHPDTLASRSNLAFTLTSQLRHAEAEAQLRLVLAAEEVNYGEEHPQCCMTRRLLAKSLAVRAQFPDALKEYQAALTGLTKAYGSRHTLVFNASYDFAITRYQSQNREQAEAEFAHLTERIVAVAGADSPDTIAFRRGLADCLASRGLLTAAQMHYHEILRVLQVSGVSEPMDQEDCRKVLKALLNHEIPMDTIGAGLADEFAKRKQRLGPDHHSTLDALQALVWWRRGKGHFKEIEAEARELVEAKERVYGPDEWITWFARATLAEALMECDRLEESAALQRRLISYFERRVGPAHMHTLTAQARLEVTLRFMGRREEALAVCKTALPNFIQAFGENGKETLVMQERLASICFELGRYEEAESLYRQLYDKVPKVAKQHSTVMTDVCNGYAGLLVTTKRGAEAEQVLRNGRQLVGTGELGSGIEAVSLQTSLVLALVQQGKFKEAASLSVECQRYLKLKRLQAGPFGILISNAVVAALLGSGNFQDALQQANFSDQLCFEAKVQKNGPSSVRAKCAQAIALRYLNRTAEWQELASELEVLLPLAFESGEPIHLLPQMLAREGTPPFHAMVHALFYSKIRTNARDQQIGLLDLRHFPPDASDELREQFMGIYFQAQELSARGEHLSAGGKFREFAEKSEPFAKGDNVTLGELYVRAAFEAVRTGRQDLAHESFSKVMDLAERMQPNEARLVGEALVQLPDHLTRTGDLEHSRPFAEIAVAATAQRLGDTHVLSTAARMALLSCLRKAQLPEEGDLLKKHAAILERALGPTHLDTIEARIAELNWHIGRKEYNEVLAVGGGLQEPIAKLFGPGSNEAVQVREAMVNALHGQGLTSVALSEFRLILRDVEAAHGENSLATLTLRHRLALAVQRANHLEEAVELHRRNGAILTQLGGERNTITVEIWLNEALALITLNRHREAIEPATKALKYGNELLGENHELMKQAQVLLKAAQEGGKGG